MGKTLVYRAKLFPSQQPEAASVGVGVSGALRGSAGPRKLIALINDGVVVRGILAHLGLPTEPPEPASARAPPQADVAW